MHREAGRDVQRAARNLWTRLAVAVLVVSIIFSISACSDFSGLIRRFVSGQSALQENVETVENSNLIRLISSCLSDSNQIKTVYSSIPSGQLDGMSLAEFEEYIAVLSKLGDEKGALLSFQILKDDVRSGICDGLIEELPSQEDLLTQCVPVQLEYEVTEEDETTLVFFQEKEDGTLYLSSEWARQCVELYRFSSLYFRALQDQNVDAVYSMLQNSYSNRDYSFSNQTIWLKAQEMCRFYLLRVKTDFTEYRISAADITKIVFDQQGVLDEELLAYEPRMVTIVRSDLGGIVIHDVLTNTLKIKDLYLYIGENRTARIGDYSNNAFFESLFGSPILTTISRIEEEEGSSDSASPEYNLIVDYPTARINLRGTIDALGAWEGVITRIQIGSTGPDFSLGKSIRVGMTLDEFMADYPFADETGFILVTENDDQGYRLKIRLSYGTGDRVSEIVLEAMQPKNG